MFRSVLGITLSAALLLGPHVAAASDLQVTPLRVTLSAGEPTSLITLRNRGEEARVIQARVMAWEQEEGENRYTPTRDILVNPPIFTLGPEAAQVIRLGLAGEGAADRELAYRLYLQEVPVENGDTGARLRVVLRLGVPVFVAPREARWDVHWQAEPVPGGGLRVLAVNRGNVHARIAELRVAAPAENGESRLVESLVTHDYLLPGQSAKWLLGGDTGWQHVERAALSVVTGQGVVNLELGLGGQ